MNDPEVADFDYFRILQNSASKTGSKTHKRRRDHASAVYLNTLHPEPLDYKHLLIQMGPSFLSVLKKLEKDPKNACPERKNNEIKLLKMVRGCIRMSKWLESRVWVG